MAFKIAASMALKNAVTKCNPVILEPMMKVEVVIPEEYMGDIMGDIHLVVDVLKVWKLAVTLKLFVLWFPFQKCLVMRRHYVLALKVAEVFTMTFDHYEEVPKSVSEEIIKKYKGE